LALVSRPVLCGLHVPAFDLAQARAGGAVGFFVMGALTMAKRIFQLVLRSLLCGCVVIALQGCGQKGPLFLPDAAQQEEDSDESE
jgi:predicted small lipoprotein YifL